MKQSPFPIRGVVEGFYGTFYTFPERNDLIRFLGACGYNFYLYGPKNDRHHRARWRQPYPPSLMAHFAESVAIARDAHVTFCYTISPVESICFTSVEDFDCLTARLRGFYDCGVRAFALFLDDIIPAFCCEADRQRYASDGGADIIAHAAAHADLCNRLCAWLQRLDPACSLYLCPTEYYGTAPFSPYLHELGRQLHPAIDVFYTGPEVCSGRISTADVAAFAQAVRRSPIIWDNYPVNDLGMRAEMHIGPLQGRAADLYHAARGLVANVMLQPEASKIPLLTIADYLVDPHNYQPQESWQRALRRVAGAESYEALRLFAENTLFSVLGVPEAEKLEALAGAALVALRRGEPAAESAAVRELDGYLSTLDEACYHLRYYMTNLQLRHDLLPWLELLDLWQDMARHGLAVLRAHECGQPYGRSLRIMTEWMAAAQRHHKRIAGNVLLPLAEYVLERLAQEQAVPVVAIGSELDCKANC
ncbi:MAG TPA: protein O-GlcNAcase [Anaerolineae bacterium]